MTLTFKIEKSFDSADDHPSKKDVVVTTNEAVVREGLNPKWTVGRLRWCPRLLRWMLLTLSAVYLIFGFCVAGLVNIFPSSFALMVLRVCPVWVAAVMQIVIIVALVVLFIFNYWVRMKCVREFRLAQKEQLDFMSHQIDSIKELVMLPSSPQNDGPCRYEVKVTILQDGSSPQAK